MDKQTRIRINQVWRINMGTQQIVIIRKQGTKWKVNILTEKAGTYGGVHTLSETTLRKRYTLIS